ncbi:hypothetical protein AX16_008378, partial [Volvariella volvacea WC 439]
MTDAIPKAHLFSPFERCPNEILARIEEHIRSISPWDSEEHERKLRLTCRRLNSFFTQFAVSHRSYSWKIVERRAENIPASLQVLNTTTSDALSLVVPAPDVFAPFISSLYVNFTIQSSQISESQSPEKAVNQLLPFWNELLRYQSLTSLTVYWSGKWMLGDQEGLFYQHLEERLLQMVYQATKGRLTRLNWTYPFDLHLDKPLSQSVPRFEGLHEVWIKTAHARRFQSAPPPPSLLGSIVRLNPCLRIISLVCDSLHPLCRSEDLLPPGTRALDVEKLLVTGILPNVSVPPEPPPSTSLPALPALKHLTEVIIHCNITPDSRSVDLDLLWITLKDQGICLRKVDLHYGISEALMDYLASYEGVEELRLDTFLVGARLSPSLDSLAKRVLPRHASSLISLNLTPEEDPRYPSWQSLTMNIDFWPKPSKFLHLRTLRVRTPASWDFKTRQFQLLLDYVAELPGL